MLGFPFVIYYLLGTIFNADISLAVKLGLLLALFLTTGFSSRFYFDDRLYNVLPIAIYMATKFWMMVTFVLFFFPCKGCAHNWLS